MLELWEITDASGTTTYTYDSMDRLISKATPEGTLNYTFDAAGHVASIASSNTNGASMSYTYDDLNRLSTVVGNRLSDTSTLSGINAMSATYNADDKESSETYDQNENVTATGGKTDLPPNFARF